MWDRFFTIFLVVAGIVFAFLFNYAFLENIIIPDPCRYHSQEPGFVFKLFYSFLPGENGHPSPSTFNLLLTVTTGGILGWLLAKQINKRKETT